MKKYGLSLAAALIAGCAFAQSGSAEKWPIGLGPLKIGMTRGAIEALRTGDGVYLGTPMTQHQNKGEVTPPNQEIFDASLITPLSSAALSAVLSFEGGNLVGLHVRLNPRGPMLVNLKNQIAEKYGPGKVEDGRKEEQCLYKNGANFKITSGALYTRWTESVSETELVQTTLSDFVADSCPINLSYGSAGPIAVQSLSIVKKSKLPQPGRPSGLF